MAENRTPKLETEVRRAAKRAVGGLSDLLEVTEAVAIRVTDRAEPAVADAIRREVGGALSAIGLTVDGDDPDVLIVSRAEGA